MSDSDNGKKKNLYALRYGNSDGELRFGHVTGDNEITAVLLRSGYFHDHYITLDGTGELCTSTGLLSVCEVLLQPAGAGTWDPQLARAQ